MFFTMFMTIFGGTFFEVADGPLATIARFTINHYAIESMADILTYGENLSEQGVGIAIMAGITLVGPCGGARSFQSLGRGAVE